MTDRDAFIRQLTATLGPNPRLRDALTDTVFAVISDEHERAESSTLSYLELLEQLARQQKDAHNAGKTRLEESLRQLCRQLTQELHHSALELHRAVKAGLPPDFENLNRIGIDVEAFPVTISPAYNLSHLSEQYFLTTRDIQTLRQYFPDNLPELTRTLQQEQHTCAQLLYDVAWEALSTGLFPDRDLLHFSDTCKHAFQSRRVDAENALMALLTGKSLWDIHTVTPQLNTWLHQFGRLHWPLLHTLFPQTTPLILHTLVRMPDPIGLEALAAMPSRGRDAALLFTLLTLRFGDRCPFSPEEWPSWLRHTLDSTTQRSEATTFWQSHPYTLPILVLDWLSSTASSTETQALKIPEILTRKMLSELGETAISDLLARRCAAMSAHEIRTLEDLSGISTQRDAQTPQTDLAQKLHEPSPLAHAVEGTVETALDAVKEGNLAEAVLVTALDKGSAGLRQKLTVTIDEEPEESPTIGFSEAISSPTPRTHPPKEPDTDLWQDRLLPFVTENWAPLSGGSMILTGLLLLEFYIWDKAAWIRYGVSPVIIALVSLVLTFMGRRLNRDAEKTETSLAIIQGLSVFLAPLSLLFVTLFFVDSDLSRINRVVGGIVLSGVLLAAWSYVFILAISSINQALTKLYSGTLLLINGLLLLLSIAQLMAPGGNWLTSGTKTLLVIGFYTGFGILSWSLRTALRTILDDEDDAAGGMIFYSVTCFGTFVLVWGLTHAHLRVLPQPFTYGPLLVLLSVLFMMIEFMLLDCRKQTGRITSLSYAAYFFIGLGLLLSIGQEYVRVGTLLLAGGVWAYQAYKLRRMPPPPGLKSTYSIRHENIALILITLGLSLIAAIRHFPPEAFPFLALGIALTLYGLAHHTRIFKHNPFVLGLSPIYLALAFALSLVWQWSQHLDPFGYGVAFLFFGLFGLYLGATTGKLIHVHAGIGYFVAALPYLGMMDMELFTLEGNTLVFGLAILGIAWTAVSSLAPFQPFKDSRSTVLWNIGVLALCLMCLRLFLQETLDFSSTSVFLQFQILSAPIIIGALMLLVGYFTNSYPAIYLALVIFIFIFPEIKDQLLKLPGVETLVSSGLGTSLTGIGLIWLVYALKFWQPLRQEKTHDVIWRQKAFPFQAGNGYLLFAHPLIVAALFLLSRNLFYRYPAKVFFSSDELSILTCVAVFVAGTGYLAFSLWYRNPVFSYIGFLAIITGLVHSGDLDTAEIFSPEMMPILLLIAFVYSEGICFTVSKGFLSRAAHIVRPFRHVKFFFLWLMALTSFFLYALFWYHNKNEGSGLWYWLPLMLYFCGIAGWFIWRTHRLWRAWFILIPGYLLFWQVILVIVAAWERKQRFLDGFEIPFHLATAGTVLAIVLAFFFVEWRLSTKRFRILSPILWISLIFLGIWSLVSIGSFYDHPFRFMPWPSLAWNFAIWAIVSVLLGRYISFAPLWLWTLFLLHFLALPRIPDYGRLYWSIPPVILAGFAGILGLLVVFTKRFPRLYRQHYSWPWSDIEANTPPVMFALVSQLFVIAAFWQAMMSAVYQPIWMKVAGLFLAALPALLVAPSLKISRRVLFSFPYLGAWVGLAIAIQATLSQYLWQLNLPLQLLIACGFFGAIATLLLSEYFRPSSNFAYMTIKYTSVLSILVCVVVSYLPVRNIQLLSWQEFFVYAILLFGSALFFKHSVKL